MNKGTYKRLASCGPGGRKCSCCFPPSGTKSRAAEKRLAERKARQADKAQVKTELDE